MADGRRGERRRGGSIILSHSAMQQVVGQAGLDEWLDPYIILGWREWL